MRRVYDYDRNPDDTFNVFNAAETSGYLVAGVRSAVVAQLIVRAANLFFSRVK